MYEPFKTTEFDEDLHTLMAIAIVCGNRGVSAPVRPIYEAWAAAYPDDALGPVGIGLSLVGEGRAPEGCAMIERASETATTRAEQAREVLARLKADMGAMAR